MNETLKYRLGHQHKQLEYLVAGVSNDALRKRPVSDKWSVYENIAHLGCYQEVFRERITSVLLEDKPVFGRYHAEDDPSFSSWLTIPTDKMRERITKDRESLARDLLALTEQQRGRLGKHPVLGWLTIEDWTEFFLLHESHHFYTIFWLVQEHHLSGSNPG